jgi:predicted Zn-dependent protease
MHQLAPMRLLHVALLAAYFLATGCAINPATGELDFMLVSEAEEKVLGERSHSQITSGFGGVYKDEKLSAYLDSVGQRLAAHTELPELGYKFTILDSPVANAFAAPGGYVYVTRGLMALPVSEAQLAGFLGHELAHINARHTAQRVTLRVAQVELCKRLHCDPNGALLKRFGLRDEVLHLRRFSHEQDYEADTLAVRYLARAGYPPDSMVSLLNMLLAHGSMQSKIATASTDEKRPSHTSTHPLTAERLDQIVIATRQSRISAARPAEVANLAAAYLTAVDGLLYGNRADVGFILGPHYANPVKRITFDVPDGFIMTATSDQVIAAGPGDSLIIFEAAKIKFAGTMQSYLTTLWARDLKLAKFHTVEINGMEAAIGWAQRETARGPLKFRLVAIRADKENIYRFLAVAPAKQSELFARQLRDSIFSFRRLSAVEATNLKPRRLRVVTVLPGDSPINLSHKMAVPDFQWEQFAILNGLFDFDATAKLKPGEKVKLISR